MKRIRRFLWFLGALLVLLLVAAVVGLSLFRSTPSWYRAIDTTPEQRTVLANQAVQRMADSVSWAAAVRARQVRQNRSAVQEPSLSSLTVSFDQDQLQALLDQAQTLDPGAAKQLDQYVSNLQIALADGRIIIGAMVNPVGSILSVQFEPHLDGQGRLVMALRQITAGNLPVPQSLVGDKLERLESRLADQIHAQQGSASLDASYAGNGAAVSVVMLRILLDGLQGQSSEPVVFLPFDVEDWRRGVAVKVLAVAVADQKLTLTFQPLPDGQISVLNGQIQRP